MKNRNIAVVLSILFIFAFMVSPVLVSAENTAWFALEPGIADVKPGAQFSVTLKGQDTSDICVYEAVLIYDHDKLELTGVKSEMSGTWYSVGPKDKNGKTYFGFIKTSSQAAENKENKISVLTFRAKSTGNTKIKLESITLFDSNSAEHNYTVDKTVSININDGGTEPESTLESTPGPTQTPTPESNKIVVKPEMGQGEAVAKVGKEELAKAVEKAKPDQEGVKEVTIEMSEIVGAKRYVQQLPSEVVTSKTLDKKIRIETPIGNIVIPNNMLTENDINGESHVQLSIGVSDKTNVDGSVGALIGNRPVIELNVKAGDRTIEWKNTDAPVTIALDYKPTTEELSKSEQIVVLYIDNNGKAVAVPSSKYDANNGKVIFTTNHFSKYAVAFVQKSFKDMDGFEWANKAVEAMASRGIINGTGENTFEPDADITRADFMLLLVKSLGLTAEVKDNFIDVSKDDYYYQAVGIAKKLGIAKGDESNRFNPNEKLSRQDMMTLAVRAMSAAGKKLAAGTQADMEKYQDKGDIALYAKESVSTLIKNGIIIGDGNAVRPLDNVSRAETAVMVYRIFNR